MPMTTPTIDPVKDVEEEWVDENEEPRAPLSPKASWPASTGATASSQATQTPAVPSRAAADSKEMTKTIRMKQDKQSVSEQLSEANVGSVQYTAWSNSWITTELWKCQTQCGQDLYCSLCSRWADHSHMQSNKHVAKVLKAGYKPVSRKEADERYLIEQTLKEGGLLTPSSWTDEEVEGRVHTGEPTCSDSRRFAGAADTAGSSDKPDLQPYYIASGALLVYKWEQADDNEGWCVGSYPTGTLCTRIAEVGYGIQGYSFTDKGGGRTSSPLLRHWSQETQRAGP